MTIHQPNYDAEPTGVQIKEARLSAGLTQVQAAKLLGLVVTPETDGRGAMSRSFQEYEGGKRPMPIGLWHLFLLLIDQHKDLLVTKRRL